MRGILETNHQSATVGTLASQAGAYTVCYVALSAWRLPLCLCAFTGLCVSHHVRFALLTGHPGFDWDASMPFQLDRIRQTGLAHPRQELCQKCFVNPQIRCGFSLGELSALHPVAELASTVLHNRIVGQNSKLSQAQSGQF